MIVTPAIGEWWVSEHFDFDIVVIVGVTDSAAYVRNIEKNNGEPRPYGISYPVARSWLSLRYRPMTKLEKYLNGYL
jgi:hypothetical protein